MFRGRASACAVLREKDADEIGEAEEAVAVPIAVARAAFLWVM